MRIRIFVLVVLVGLLEPVYLCAGTPRQETFLRRQAKASVFALSQIMMHDVVSPVIASRYYMYCTIGGYAILSHANPHLPFPDKFIRHFPAAQRFAPPVQALKAPADLAALFCILETGSKILPSGFTLADRIAQVQKSCLSNGYSASQVAAASAYAKMVAGIILQYAETDGYRNLSAFPKYRPRRREGFWFPTPPAYMDAVDPNWQTMRPLVIDSARQFLLPPPVPFDTAVTSPFMALTREVMETGNSMTPAQREIAGFWDCNPFVVATSGHMSLGFKKISPGGHWMNIAGIAAEKRGLSGSATITVLALEGITLYDAFLACWAQKYSSDRVRPETVINKYLDIKWQPLLQTPPFPEFTSGHSVISSASAEVLSFLLGDALSYTDDSEVIFELAPRQFTSFRQAAEEASISRLYGGIHFRDGVEAGQRQGKEIGRYLIHKLMNAGVKPL